MNQSPNQLILRLVRLSVFIVFLFLSLSGGAQTPQDSLQTDSLQIRIADSLQRVEQRQADSLASVPPPIRDTIRPSLQFPFTSDSFLYRKRLFYSFTNPVRYTISEREWQGKDVMFYATIGLLILFSLIKNSFGRYLSDLFSSYFRTTVRQRQVKEQLLQNPLPSLLFNVFFILSGALFVSLLLPALDLAKEASFWLLSLYSAAALAFLYTGKFILLKFFGWLFQLTEVVDNYIFIIFSTSKVIGVVLLPFTVLLAFTYGTVSAAAVTLSILVIACLYAYRYFLAFLSISRSVRINLFHFLLFVLAFEVLPVLLINKLLFLYLTEIY